VINDEKIPVDQDPEPSLEVHPAQLAAVLVVFS